MAQGHDRQRNTRDKELPEEKAEQQRQRRVQSPADPSASTRPSAAGVALTGERRAVPTVVDGGACVPVTARQQYGPIPAQRRPIRSYSESRGDRDKRTQVYPGGADSDGWVEGHVHGPSGSSNLVQLHGPRGRVPNAIGVGSGSGGGSGASGCGVLEMGIKSMEVQDDSFVVETVEIIKRPGQTLGFYIREGNGFDRSEGVFISRIQMGTVAESNGLLHVGDEILTVNNVRVSNMSLDDVVILMSIPKKLVLTIRTRRNCNKNKSCPSLALTDKDEPPIVVLKKGRSSSASALEMTEKCPDAYEPYAQHAFHPADYLHSRRDVLHERPTSSRYASIFISPDKAHARLLTDDPADSGNSSDGSLPRSVDSGKDHPYGAQDLERATADSPASYLSPSATMGSAGSNFVGEREYLKYLLPEGLGRKTTPKSPSKSMTLGSHQHPHGAFMSDESPMYSEPPYMNIGPYREGLPVQQYRQYHEDKKSQERLRDLLHSKSRYNKLLRSRSPECYNSDSEVIFTHQRIPDSRGFASDYETYAGAVSDDDGPVYSIPRIPSSSSSELEVLLQKFTTLSQELQQEQSKLQRQLSTREKGRKYR